MREIEVKIENLCKKYDPPCFQNIRDNLMTIIESAEPTNEEKLEAFDLYDEWLHETYRSEERKQKDERSN